MGRKVKDKLNFRDGFLEAHYSLRGHLLKPEVIPCHPNSVLHDLKHPDDDVVSSVPQKQGESTDAIPKRVPSEPPCTKRHEQSASLGPLQASHGGTGEVVPISEATVMACIARQIRLTCARLGVERQKRHLRKAPLQPSPLVTAHTSMTLQEPPCHWGEEECYVNPLYVARL